MRWKETMGSSLRSCKVKQAEYKHDETIWSMGCYCAFIFPAAILVGMSVGSLITGNTVIIKPASDTPIISYKIVEIMIKAGVP